MCLALPARVVELKEDDNAVIELDGVRKEVSLALVSDIDVGDYVLIHVGYALNKVSEEEAMKTLEMFAEAGLVSEGAA
jgi:hydrogenase expression/formation protein HypC